MSSDVVVYESHSLMQPSQVVGHVARVQEVMSAVMKPSVHYGTIPGTDKPTLFKPGAEVLCMTFRIAPKFRIEDLSTPDSVRYRVTCYGVHQPTSIELGEGLGECSSMEDKYKWRKAASNAEFDALPADRRRIKYGYNRNQNREYEIKQVRSEPADIANTILKMAAKRAHVAMALNVTAASDMFNQDLEDLPPELREEFTDSERGGAPVKTNVEGPKSKTETEKKTPPADTARTTSNGDQEDRPATDGEKANVRIKLKGLEIDEAKFTEVTGLTIDALTLNGFKEAKVYIGNPHSYKKPETASA